MSDEHIIMASDTLQCAIAKSAQLVALFILTTSISMAGVVYTYTYISQNYYIFPGFDPYNIYDSSMHIEISFTTDSKLINFDGNATEFVTSFRVSDGVHLLTEADAGASFKIKTDSSGNIREWDVYVSGSTESGSTRVETYYVYGGTFRYAESTTTSECISYTFGICNSWTWTAATSPFSGGSSETSWSVSELLFNDDDNDGLTDNSEINIHDTDPTDADTDNDGMSDGYEISEGFDPLDNTDCPNWICIDGSRRGWRLGIGI